MKKRDESEKKSDADEQRNRKPNEKGDTFAKLNAVEKELALELFATDLKKFLSVSDERTTRQELMKNIGKGMKPHKDFDPRQFDEFLRGLNTAGYLTVGFRRLSELSDKLSRKFDQVQTTVVAGNSEDRFNSGAAQEFVAEIARIGAIKKQRFGEKAELCIGIMSGRTTRLVVGAACCNWAKEFGFEPKDLPHVKVFALNVSLTDPTNLGGNATVLAYRLAGSIREQTQKKVVAEAYGLSAPLVIEQGELQKTDTSAAIHNVVLKTDPGRLPNPNADQRKTALDLVLTGVGELPSGQSQDKKDQGSIYYSLARDHEFDMEAFTHEQKVIGDLAFTAIRSDGEPVPLVKDGKQYLFYSAVRLSVLEEMARDDDKAVILVARESPGKNKIPPIFASIGGAGPNAHRYVSKLVVDEPSAKSLLRF